MANAKNSDFYDLSIRYLSGSASEEDVRRLEELVRSDNELASQYQEIKKTWQLTASSEMEFDTDKAWKQVSDTMEDTEAVSDTYPFSRTRNPFTNVLRIAATILVFAAAGYLMYLMFNTGGTTEFAATDQPFNTELEDGSHITLNRNSLIAYESKYNRADRRVRLIGSAFFEVARDTSKPFMVQTEHMTVEVLGTSFLVNAREETENYEVIVQSGRVRVTTAAGGTIELSKGEKCVLNTATAQLHKAVNTDPNYLSWKTKELVFEHAHLSDVVKAVENTYNIKIDLKVSGIDACYLTATYIDYSVEDALMLIAETFDLTLNGSDEHFELSGSGCEESTEDSSTDVP